MDRSSALARGILYNAQDVGHTLGVTVENSTPDCDSLPGFLTFFDPGWDLLRLRAFCDDKGRTIFSRSDWYEREAFAKVGDEPCYRQIQLEVAGDSFNEDFDSQWRLLPETEEVPHVRVVAMGMVLHYLSSGLRIFARSVVRCADKSSGGGRVCVGYFGGDDLVVDSYWDGLRDDDLGLASSRKC
jgi:hypothetical protein